MSTSPQRPLLHHLFTSFGGQRTVHASPGLADQLPALEARAQAAYHAGPGWECLHADGLWLATFAIGNGTDHVGRPRMLVHQVAIRDNHLPALFSPLWLRRATLARLDSPDPGALAARLPDDLAGIDLRTVLPPPAEFSQLLLAPVRAAAGALLQALRRAGAHVEQEVPGALAGGDALAAVLCAALLHQPACRISTWRTPLPMPAGSAAPSTLVLRDAATARTSTAETMLGGGFYPSDWILDLLAGSGPTLPRLMAVLRTVPLPTLLERPWPRAAVQAIAVVADLTDREGRLLPDRRSGALADALADLAENGLRPWVAWMVAQVRDRSSAPSSALQSAILEPDRAHLRAAFTA
ncbi:MAG: hypothetical protein RLZZ127_459 [Planctomycetota bacterium]|jgi:hypothetical protein